MELKSAESFMETKMTLEEIAENCGVSLEKLKCYEEHGLIHGEEKDGEVSYEYEDVSLLRKTCVLQEAGFTIEEIVIYMQLEAKQLRPKQLLMMAKKRKALLECIHDKQKILDDLDYMMIELKKEEERSRLI